MEEDRYQYQLTYDVIDRVLAMHIIIKYSQ